jgi:holo-[acyl-carrier protein] synthase
MTKLATGVDLVEIERLDSVIHRYGQHFLERIYTPQELTDAGASLASLAARFAAKEAVSKALGCGIGKVAWKEIEVLRGPDRQPILYLHGEAARLAKEHDLINWSISLSHSRTHAIAFVVAVDCS